MTGITAEKHESFISPTAGGHVIMEFSGKELIQGEPDASSFPSGGLRATFEARGYTAWDPTSYAFIKDDTLCIPTAFCSYTGESLDKKTPLLRSMNVISKASVRALKLFGITTSRVQSTVGPEQEYFLVDKALFDQRKDLVYTGRTLFGAPSPRGQEMEDHYFGMIKPRVRVFMKDLDTELWKLGVHAKTEHNEVAPAQHELAPIFSMTNIATDHNQLTMEFMKKVALKHGMVCLLHEKPFAGVNGSGKHNNWSLSTAEGKNLLSPSDNPYKNTRFLLFLAAVIKAVDEHQDLLRISVASAGNDHRLGANEAPPAIVSIFLGTQLTDVLEAVAAGRVWEPRPAKALKLSDDTVPALMQDNSDRNRTSPFAFTGNKFEFRMLGSSASVSGPNIILNTIVADALNVLVDKIEGADDVDSAVYAVVRDVYNAHKRIIFNGNGYSDEWVKEAERRGLLNLKSTPECLPLLAETKNVELFDKYGIFTPDETTSRVHIFLENYSKTIAIEADAALDMLYKDILPSIEAYVSDLTQAALRKKKAGIAGGFEADLATKLSDITTDIYERAEKLTFVKKDVAAITSENEKATAYHEQVLAAMQALREKVDEAEPLVAQKYLTYPTYGQLLFGVND